jgi:hypothetical protein
MHHMMVCVNEACNYFTQHPEIVINCWKHSKLNSSSTEAFIPSLPNVMAHLDDEFHFLMSQIAQYTGDCIAPDAYLMIDNNEEVIHSTLNVQDIINEVRFESEPPEEEEDNIKPPEISHSEWNQCRQTLLKLEYLFPGEFATEISALTSSKVKQVLPPLKQLSVAQFLSKNS